jgi:RNase P/RNase MRP subunit p29
VATLMRHGVRNLAERLESEIEGVVDSCASATSFSVNGIAVNAATAFFRDGPVTCGNRVEVKGQVVGGVFNAALVKSEDDSSSDRNELHGSVVSADTATRTFVLNHPVHGNVTVSYALAVFKDGTAANLASGAHVEVKGRLLLGGVLQAVKVDFED